MREIRPRFSMVRLVPSFLLLAPALAQAQTPGEWPAILQLGGPVVMVLLAMSVVAFAVSLYKILQLRSYRSSDIFELERAVEHWCHGRTDEARDSASDNRSPLAPLLVSGMAWLSFSDDDNQRKIAEAELSRMAQEHLWRLSSKLGVLEQVSYLAPLLGLLGTVLGIIDVFHGLAGQGSSVDSAFLAGGIWEALLTTAVGLCVAIPFALLHSAFQSKVESMRQRLQDILSRLFTAPLYRDISEAG